MQQTRKRVYSTFGKELPTLEDSDVIRLLRSKWREIPGTREGRCFSADCLSWSDKELLDFWEDCMSQTTVPEVRGWFQSVYQHQVADKRLLDIGCGLGIDGIFFTEQGAKVTFADIVDDNLKVVKRICKLKEISAEFYLIEDLKGFSFEFEFDIIMAIGSLHHIPFEIAQREISALLKCLKQGGRFMMLAYPRERFDEYCQKYGCDNQADFGKVTDGNRTPWAEWYNAEKIRRLFGPGCHLNWWRNFGQNNREFNWFELSKLHE